MSDKEDNSIYKLIVIIATGLLILWYFAKIESAVSDYSIILGFIAGPVLLYLGYRIMKAIWPDL